MLTVQEVKAIGRTWRRPNHPFLVETTPYAITPMFIAPVLPGETVKRLMWQARVVSDPVKHPLIGWWQEFYFFYVKHRDLADRDKLSAMMLNPNEDMSSLKTSTAVPGQYFFANAGAPAINWVDKCLRRITETFFRDENEAWNAATLTVNGATLPMARAFGKDANWMDSLTVDANMPEVDPNDTSEQADDPQYRMWQYLTKMKLVNLSYEGWLRTFGINTPKTELHEPELLRYVRQWQYPSNTINPVDGAPSSALSWSIQGRGDKDRFIKEPGFLFGVTVTRPKVYMRNQKGSLTSFMQSAMEWLPPLLWDEQFLGLKNFADNTGPIDTTDTGGYWVDLRDLFMYGEQFTNVDLTADTTRNSVSLPSTTGSISFASSSDVTALFKTAGSEKIKMDGTVSLQILGKQQDNT